MILEYKFSPATSREIIKCTFDVSNDIRYLIASWRIYLVFLSPNESEYLHAACKGLYVNILRGTFVTMTLRVARIVRTPLHWRKAKVSTGTSRIERLRVTSAGATYDLNDPRVHLFRLDFNATLNSSIYSMNNSTSARLIGTVK